MRRTTSSSARATRSTSGSCRDSCSASTTTGISIRTSTPAGTASGVRRSRPRQTSSTENAPSTIENPVDRGAQLVLPAIVVPDAGCSSCTTRPDFVQPGFRAQRGAELHRRRPPGLLDLAGPGRPGGFPIPWDPDSVAYVWADALVDCLSALTYARPGEDLVEHVLAIGAASARQGHPAIPLRLLARDAVRRRVRGAASSCSSTGGCYSTTGRSRSRSGTSVDPSI